MRHSHLASWLSLGTGLLLLVHGSNSPQGFAEGVHLFQGNHFAAALASFRASDEAMGNEAPANLLFNRALAALRVGEIKEAEISAERAAARGGPKGYALRDFILGNASFRRGERAAREASLPEGGPRAIDRAILSFQQAIQHWKAALQRRSPWPEAENNIRLSEERIKKLQKRSRQLPKKPRKEKRPNNRRKGTPTLPKPQPRVVPSLPAPLSPRQVQALLQHLRRSEKAKWALRRTKRLQRPATAGRAW